VTSFTRQPTAGWPHARVSTYRSGGFPVATMNVITVSRPLNQCGNGGIVNVTSSARTATIKSTLRLSHAST
jgi:hypothetical protein